MVVFVLELNTEWMNRLRVGADATRDGNEFHRIMVRGKKLYLRVFVFFFISEQLALHGRSIITISAGICVILGRDRYICLFRKMN